MSLRSQISPFVLVGASIADLPNPATVAQGYIFHAHTGEAFILEIDPATQTRSWAVFQSAGLSSGWPKYVVSTVAGPAAQFIDPQSAINAAVVDGHGPNAPAIVLVMPGPYTLTGGVLNMAAGIDVVGLAGNAITAVGVPASDVIFSGDVVVNFTFGAATIANVTVAGRLLITGSSTFNFSVSQSLFSATVGDALSYTNTGAGSQLFLQQSSFIGNGAGLRGASISSTAVTVTATDCTFSGSGGSPTTAAFLAHRSGNLFTRCTFSGTVNELNGGSGTQEYRDCVFSPNGSVVLQICSGSTSNVFGGKIIGSPTDPFFQGHAPGPATLVANKILVPGGNHISIGASLLSSVANYEFRDYSESNIAGSTPFAVSQSSLSDVITVTQNGAWALTLPSLLGVLSGQRITITNLHATPGALTMTPNGADTVSAQATYTSSVSVRSVTLQTRNESGTTDWRIVSLSPL